MDSKAAAIAARINKKYGEGTIIKGSEIDYSTIARITSGSLSLDMALGGGWPVNRWNELIGDESHGKTAVVLKTIAANQKIDKNWQVVWIAAEPFVPEYAAKLGCDNDRIIVVDTNAMELAFQVTLEYLDSRVVDCIVIDSLPALVPNEEAEHAMEDAQVGLGARLTGKFFRKQGPAGKRSMTEQERACTGFIINQWREKIGVRYGDPRTTPGGRAKNFYYFTRAEVRRDEWIEVEDVRVGQAIKIRLLKNKTAPPQKVADVDFYFADALPFHAGDYDTVKEVVNVCIAKNVLTRKGSYYVYGEEQWQGRNALIDQIREDLDLQDSLRNEALDLVLKTSSPLRRKSSAANESPSNRVRRRSSKVSSTDSPTSQDGASPLTKDSESEPSKSNSSSGRGSGTRIIRRKN